MFQCVKSLLEIAANETSTQLPTDKALVDRVTDRFNSSLVFDPSETRMAYTIRDPVVFGTDFNCDPRGFANRLEIRSRMWDACLVLDGALSYPFNDGAVARLEICDEDALKTVEID